MRNARFIPDYPYSTVAFLRDLREGMRYDYDNQEHTLPWMTNYHDLEQLPFVRRTTHDRFGWPVYRFDIPLVLGILEISNLQINVPNEQRIGWRLDMPVDYYPFEVRLEGDGADNYWQVKAYISAALGDPINGWERDDQLHAEWNSDGVQIGLTYWITSFVTEGESGYASLNITNERIYPEYFTDDYTQSFSIDKKDLIWHTFNAPDVIVPLYYRSSQWVRFTLQALRDVLTQRNQHLAVWYDKEAGKMGFANDKQLCKIVAVKPEQSFTLSLLDHDRGHYSHDLSILNSEKKPESVLNGSVGSLDGVVEILKNWGFIVDVEN